MRECGPISSNADKEYTRQEEHAVRLSRRVAPGVFGYSARQRDRHLVPGGTTNSRGLALRILLGSFLCLPCCTWDTAPAHAFLGMECQCRLRRCGLREPHMGR